MNAIGVGSRLSDILPGVIPMKMLATGLVVLLAVMPARARTYYAAPRSVGIVAGDQPVGWAYLPNN